MVMPEMKRSELGKTNKSRNVEQTVVGQPQDAQIVKSLKGIC